ncbi:EamA family transporter [Litorivicinus lipolyticus]|uniref:EamA family transporter n=1 Tax=Litorivicinus lipolyticus TaxID=418701 RepID=A0A5Q2Q836_9GAMM|nr:DMT family transporter [Litorivicinus lipolyticus]QGG80759.1 EamA family transporter [Litorivicinus lipolyticus]
MNHYRENAMAWGALIIAMLIWSSSFVASKFVLVDFTPEQAVGIRLLLAAAATLPWLLIWGREPIKRMRAEHWKWLIIMSLFEPCLYFLAEMNGLLYTSASAAGLVTSTLPIWIAIGAWLLLKERLSRNLIIGLGLALSGTLTMTALGEANVAAPNPLLGNALMVVATLMAAGYVLVAKRLTAELSPWLVTVLQIWVGAVFFVPFLLLNPPDLSTPSTTAWQAMVWLGLVVSIGAYGLYNLGISQVPAQVAGLSVNLLPLFTLVLAAVILGERLNVGEMAGAMLILIGILVAVWPTRVAQSPSK